MGIMKSLLGTQSGNSHDYIELTEANLKAPESAADLTTHLSKVEGQQQVMAIKDTLYNGDMVVADLRPLPRDQKKRARQSLAEYSNELGGNIISDGENLLILAPSGVRVSEKLL
jgi:hypothetical protein